MFFRCCKRNKIQTVKILSGDKKCNELLKPKVYLFIYEN